MKSVCSVGSFIIGGCSKGDVILWDTRESLSKHHQVSDDNSHVARFYFVSLFDIKYKSNLITSEHEEVVIQSEQQLLVILVCTHHGM